MWLGLTSGEDVCYWVKQSFGVCDGWPALCMDTGRFRRNTKSPSAASLLFAPPWPHISPLDHRETSSVHHTATRQAARVHLCKFILRRSKIVPPHFLLIKISVHVAVIFLWGFFVLCNKTLKNKTRRGEKFPANACTCLVLCKQNVGGRWDGRS